MTQQNNPNQQPNNSGFTFEQKIILFNLMLTLALVAVVFIAMWQLYQPKTAAPTPQVIVVTPTAKLMLPTAEPTKPSIYAMPTIPAFGIGGRPIHQRTDAVVVTLSVEDQKLADDLINQMKTDVAK